MSAGPQNTHTYTLHFLSFPSSSDRLCLPDLSETLEMREKLQRQLQEIMSATKKTTSRRSSARLGSGGTDSHPHTPGRNANARRTLEALRYETPTDQGAARHQNNLQLTFTIQFPYANDQICVQTFWVSKSSALHRFRFYLTELNLCFNFIGCLFM